MRKNVHQFKNKRIKIPIVIWDSDVRKTKNEYRLKVRRSIRGMDGSLYIAIPKYWAAEVGLQKNDPVEVEFLSKNELIIRIPVKEQ